MLMLSISSECRFWQRLTYRKQLVGDFDPSMAPLLLSYGRALYELALSQSGVMGKEEVAKGTDPAVAAEAAADSGKNGKFVFEGDGDEEEEEEDDEAEGGEQEGGEDGDEPEDDFNAAWEVLDVARTIYERKVADMSADEGREDRLNLSETYLTLGDVSLETGRSTNSDGADHRKLPPSGPRLHSSPEDQGSLVASIISCFGQRTLSTRYRPGVHAIWSLCSIETRSSSSGWL